MYGPRRASINISGLNPRLFPPPLPLSNALQRLPARPRAEVL
jgi:hypothetical protein